MTFPTVPTRHYLRLKLHTHKSLRMHLLRACVNHNFVLFVKILKKYSKSKRLLLKLGIQISKVLYVFHITKYEVGLIHKAGFGT